MDEVTKLVTCSVCAKRVEEYYTLQSFKGEPSPSAIAEIDGRLCKQHYDKLKLWLAEYEIDVFSNWEAASRLFADIKEGMLD